LFRQGVPFFDIFMTSSTLCISLIFELYKKMDENTQQFLMHVTRGDQDGRFFIGNVFEDQCYVTKCSFMNVKCGDQGHCLCIGNVSKYQHHVTKVLVHQNNTWS
jgi:hypothetical protein